MSKILLIDDHSDIRRLIRLTLGQAYEVFEAEDGVTGLEVARKARPDLIVLDVMMPGGMDGFAVLEAIRADPDLAATRVVIVTARGQGKDYDEGMRRGANAYFIKPFSPMQLVACIKDMLAKPAS